MIEINNVELIEDLEAFKFTYWLFQKVCPIDWDLSQTQKSKMIWGFIDRYGYIDDEAMDIYDAIINYLEWTEED